MSTCFVRGKSVHQFPKDKQLADEWTKRCRSKVDLKSSKICSKHFEDEDFVGGLEAKMMNKPFQPFRRILIKNAVPTLFLPERYVPRPKHHVESFSMDANTSVEPYTPDVHL